MVMAKNIYSMIERAIVNNQQFEVGKECIFEEGSMV